MKLRLKNSKHYLFLFSIMFFGICSLFVVHAVGCENRVPSALDPNCSQPALTPGGLFNRILPVIPIGITLVAMAGIGRGAFKIMTAPDTDKRGDGFKIIINVAIGAGVFYSIWLIMYLVEQFTGGSLITL